MINLPAVFVANGLGVALMLTLIFSNRRVARNMFLDDKLFYTMNWLALLLCVVETITFCVDGRSFAGAVFWNRLLNVVLFVADISFAFLWTVYVDFKLFGRLDRLHRIYPFVALPAVLITILSLANLFWNIFFTVSPQNIYARTPAVVWVYLLTYGYLAAGAVMVMVYRKKVGKYLFMPVAVFLTPIFLGSLLQFLFYGLALIWVSVSFGLVSLYINLQNEVTMLDTLTKLYNREYLTRFLNMAQQKYDQLQRGKKGLCMCGLMLDVNTFKEINDTYGHSEGDLALQAVGECLMGQMQGDRFAVRYGGDEFVIIAWVKNEQQMKNLAENIQTKVSQANAKYNRPYRLSVSVGYAMYEPGQDDMDSFLRRLDQQMYQEKRRYYSDSKNNRRSRRAGEERCDSCP